MFSWGEQINIHDEMYIMQITNGTNSQPISSQQLKLEMLPNLLPTLQSWNLGRLQPQNPIPFLGKWIPTCWSLKASYLKKKNRMWNSNPIQPTHIFGIIVTTRPPQDLDQMAKGTKTLITRILGFSNSPSWLISLSWLMNLCILTRG
jgi:hypothetical protein